MPDKTIQRKPLGRPTIDLDMDAALDLITRGERIPAVATELGVSTQTLRNRVAELQKKQGLLLKYRSIQALHLTELQLRVLEAITPEKINDASLRDLVASYKILKDKELNLEGKPSEIKGLVSHLIYIEKQEATLEDGTSLTNPIDIESKEEDDENSLTFLDDQEF